jgi:hypothetical protein
MSELHAPVILREGPFARFTSILHIPQFLACESVSPVGKEIVRGCKLNPEG